MGEIMVDSKRLKIVQVVQGSKEKSALAAEKIGRFLLDEGAIQIDLCESTDEIFYTLEIVMPKPGEHVLVVDGT